MKRVWLLMRGRELYNVASETVVAVFSSKELANAAKQAKLEGDGYGEWWGIEEHVVDSPDLAAEVRG